MLQDFLPAVEGCKLGVLGLALQLKLAGTEGELLDVRAVTDDGNLLAFLQKGQGLHQASGVRAAEDRLGVLNLTHLGVELVEAYHPERLAIDPAVQGGQEEVGDL